MRLYEQILARCGLIRRRFQPFIFNDDGCHDLTIRSIAMKAQESLLQRSGNG